MLIDFLNQLPATYESTKKRLAHCQKYGKIIFLFKRDVLVGYAELYQLKEIPKFPVIPWPKNDESGEFLYCFATACRPGQIRDLKKLAFRYFPNCKYLCYHRLKRRNKLHIERIHHAWN